MEEPTFFEINQPRMIHETIDEETLVIDSETGVYFALPGSASVVLRLLATGKNIANVLAMVASLYETDEREIQPGIEAFVAGLLREEIIVPGDGASRNEVSGNDAVLAIAREPFQPPVLQKFDDLQQLMLLDPIHDVDDKGWPYRK